MVPSIVLRAELQCSAGMHVGPPTAHFVERSAPALAFRVGDNSPAVSAAF